MENKMNRAFLFDMDGVLIDSQKLASAEDREFLESLFGKVVAERIGDPAGLSLDFVYDKALEAGAMLDKKEFLKRYDERIARVYARSQITNGIDKLVNYLSAHTFKLAIVSASPVHWMEYVLPRLSFRSSIDEIVSIQDKGLQSKPAPDGYLEALRLLKVDAHRSIVLEDSNPGITSGKAAGCY